MIKENTRIRIPTAKSFKASIWESRSRRQAEWSIRKAWTSWNRTISSIQATLRFERRVRYTFRMNTINLAPSLRIQKDTFDSSIVDWGPRRVSPIPRVWAPLTAQTTASNTQAAAITTKMASIRREAWWKHLSWTRTIKLRSPWKRWQSCRNPVCKGTIIGASCSRWNKWTTNWMITISRTKWRDSRSWRRAWTSRCWRPWRRWRTSERRRRRRSTRTDPRTTKLWASIGGQHRGSPTRVSLNWRSRRAGRSCQRIRQVRTWRTKLWCQPSSRPRTKRIRRRGSIYWGPRLIWRQLMMKITLPRLL